MTEDSEFARLVSLACHDLRTPLATVNGFARTLTRFEWFALEPPADPAADARWQELVRFSEELQAEDTAICEAVQRNARSRAYAPGRYSVRRENGAAEDTELEEGDVIEALGALEPVWDELYPAEQARILRLLIERIDVAPDGISVTLHAAGIRSLVAELADQEALAASEPLLEAAGS